MTPEELATTLAMMDHGGSFVRALAVAYRLGDPTNCAKIRETWPDYWKKYSDPMWQKGGAMSQVFGAEHPGRSPQKEEPR